MSFFIHTARLVFMPLQMGEGKRTVSELLDPYVAIGFSTGLLIIMLMIVFCLPEGGGWGQPGIHFISFLAQDIDYRFCFLLLGFVEVEYLTPVLRTDIGTLSVGLCRVVYLEKYFTEIGI